MSSQISHLLFVKAECETCQLIEPVIGEAIDAGKAIRILVQDDPAFLGAHSPCDDTLLEESYRWNVETTPTLIALDHNRETGRVDGWDRGRLA